MMPRPSCIDTLLFYKDKNLIKVLTGLRRSGKSTLLDLLKQRLPSAGVAAGQIVSVNFEDPANGFIGSYQDLYRYISSQAQTLSHTSPTHNLLFLLTGIFSQTLPLAQGISREHSTVTLTVDPAVGSKSGVLCLRTATLLSPAYRPDPSGSVMFGHKLDCDDGPMS
ncbi:MAG: AAA family ATPase [Actinomycetia bacterium]|nr:AAA family ATPase [Actinomycetes bacterium]